MRPAHCAMLVRHGGQQDNLGALRQRRQRFRCPVGDALPVGLGIEEIAQKSRDLGLLDQPAGCRLGDVAGEAEGGERQLETPRFQEMRKGPDEFEHDIVDVEHQQRPVVGGQLFDLTRSFGIVAHVERS